eukprot:2755484-Amphidinium_carterae.1
MPSQFDLWVGFRHFGSNFGRLSGRISLLALNIYGQPFLGHTGKYWDVVVWRHRICNPVEWQAPEMR